MSGYERTYAQWVAYLKSRGAEVTESDPGLNLKPDEATHECLVVILTTQYWQGTTDKERHESYFRILDAKDFDQKIVSRFYTLTDKIRDELDRDKWETWAVMLGFAYYHIHARRPKVASRSVGQIGLEVFA